MPRCERTKIAGAGHFCIVEKPEEVSERMIKFMLKHPQEEDETKAIM